MPAQKETCKNLLSIAHKYIYKRGKNKKIIKNMRKSLKK